MYQGLVHAHSGLRWIVLALLLIAVIKALSGWLGKKGFTEGDRKIALFALITTHIQLIIGFVLYFISPKVMFTAGTMSSNLLRFYTVEHMVTMLLAIVLITVGHKRYKSKETDLLKHKTIALFYGIGLILILAGIPWPFRGLGAGWF